MKLPPGTHGGVVINPQEKGMLQYLKAFKGAIEIENGQGTGFILTFNGELVAAYFEDKNGVYKGASAIRNIITTPLGDTGQQQNFILRAYDEEDYAEALDMCTRGGLLMGAAQPDPDAVPTPKKTSESSRHTPSPVDESTLTKIISQPGVVAVSAFYEGFPVVSLGEADFEHVAARAEDFLRAGTRIAQDMNLGQPDQLILESAENKFIIVPCGDLFLCIITRADAQLGLIRVLLRSIQLKVGSGDA